MAPSITEELYALGLGSAVVGVTRYCKYPPEAESKPKVGGFFDVNYEAVLQLAPTIAMAVSDDEHTPKQLERLKIPTVVVNHRSVDGILESVDQIGRACGIEAAAGRLSAELRGGINAVVERVRGRPVVRTLLAVGRGTTDRALATVFVSGQDGYYADLLRLAGADNVYQGKTITAAQFSPEGLLLLNPQVILEIIPGFEERGWQEDQILSSWQKEAPFVDAVKNRRIYISKARYADVPGPRFVQLLEDMARLLHPEAYQ